MFIFVSKLKPTDLIGARSIWELVNLTKKREKKRKKKSDLRTVPHTVKEGNKQAWNTTSKCQSS
jgi:hypothetical protein